MSRTEYTYRLRRNRSRLRQIASAIARHNDAQLSAAMLAEITALLHCDSNYDLIERITTAQHNDQSAISDVSDV